MFRAPRPPEPAPAWRLAWQSPPPSSERETLACVSRPSCARRSRSLARTTRCNHPEKPRRNTHDPPFWRWLGYGLPLHTRHRRQRCRHQLPPFCCLHLLQVLFIRSRLLPRKLGLVLVPTVPVECLLVGSVDTGRSVKVHKVEVLGLVLTVPDAEDVFWMVWLPCCEALRVFPLNTGMHPCSSRLPCCLSRPVCVCTFRSHNNAHTEVHKHPVDITTRSQLVLPERLPSLDSGRLTTSKASLCCCVLVCAASRVMQRPPAPSISAATVSSHTPPSRAHRCKTVVGQCSVAMRFGMRVGATGVGCGVCSCVWCMCTSKACIPTACKAAHTPPPPTCGEGLWSYRQ